MFATEVQASESRHSRGRSQNFVSLHGRDELDLTISGTLLLVQCRSAVHRAYLYSGQREYLHGTTLGCQEVPDAYSRQQLQVSDTSTRTTLDHRDWRYCCCPNLYCELLVMYWDVLKQRYQQDGVGNHMSSTCINPLQHANAR